HYYRGLQSLAKNGYFQLPDIPEYATNNAHMFYIVCRSLEERSSLIKELKESNILSVFHYLSLHRSGFYTTNEVYRPNYYQSIEPIKQLGFDDVSNDEVQVVGLNLPNCDRFADCLVRLPMYYELSDENVHYIISKIMGFYDKK
ncbi:MAG: hypothetical protein HDS46_05995, partial [Bacteroides sp.]|nr:hypothetical protein [Bacteroides sp.]